MNNQDFNLKCYQFQEEIINLFNAQNQISFLTKYYLFKELWKAIKKKKEENDLKIQFLKSKETKTITAKIPIQQLNKKEKNE